MVYLCLDHLIPLQTHLPNKGVDISTLLSMEALHLSVNGDQGASATDTSTAFVGKGGRL